MLAVQILNDFHFNLLKHEFLMNNTESTIPASHKACRICIIMTYWVMQLGKQSLFVLSIIWNT
jgi:hypothetical protein